MKYIYLVVPLIVAQIILLVIDVLYNPLLVSMFSVPSLFIWTIFGVITGVHLGMYCIDD